MKTKKYSSTQCPRFEGIKIYKQLDTDLLVDCNVAYNGDSKFIVTYKHIRAGIRNFEFNGNLRVNLRNFMQLNAEKKVEIIEISFLSAPTFNFELLDALAPFELFASGDLIRTILTEAINSHLVEPNKKIIHL